MRKSHLLLVTTLGLASIAFAVPALLSLGWADTGTRWTAPRHRDHPLVGMIWSAQDRRFVTETELHDRLANADAVILGEIHDNPDHHSLQAEILQAIIDRGRKPALIFEMISQDLEQQLDNHLRDHPGDAEGLGSALGWEERGWPDWSMYQPIAEVAMANGLAMLAGDLASATKRAVGKRGFGALSEDERKRLNLSIDLPAEVASSLDATLLESHCGLLPKEALAPMRMVQRARDSAMAEAIEQAGQAKPVVLLAGAGHARRDWGVPLSLASRAPRVKVTSLAFVEASSGAVEPAAYMPESVGPETIYDFLFFTPAAQREEPCTTFTRQVQERSRGSGLLDDRD